MAESPFQALFAKRVRSELKNSDFRLDNIRQAYHILGSPGRNLKTVLIGGTNGKGSTAGYLWQLLTAHGNRVGIFTSPHIISFTERIQTSHKVIDEDELLKLLGQIRSCLSDELYETLSFFEVSTLLAMSCFAELGCTHTVMEVGLGGRLDATNICHPDLTAITSIGLDHSEILGDNLTDIASEKAGIFRSGIPVFVGFGREENPEAFAVLQDRADKIGAGFYPPPAQQASVHYLMRNLGLAQRIFAELQNSAPPSIDGIRVPPSLRCRFELFQDSTGQTWLLDVCHNAAGAQAFVETLRHHFPDDLPLPGLVTILADKDVDAILDILSKVLSPLVLFSNDTGRSLALNDLSARHRGLPFFEGFLAGAHMILPTANPKTPIVVCGSVRALGEVLPALGQSYIL